MNRQSAHGVTNFDQIERMFNEPPSGYTPLVPLLNEVFKLRAARPGYDKKLLVFIVTDGASTDYNGDLAINELEDLLKNGRNSPSPLTLTLLLRTFCLRSFEIIVVCDDSGSMNGIKKTRWNYAQQIIDCIFTATVSFSPNGLHIYFLNRQAALAVQDSKDLNTIFAEPPSGYTPLMRILKFVFDLPVAKAENEKKRFVYVLTDGTPTDDYGNEQIHELEVLLNEQRSIDTTYVHFIACTDDKENIQYLSNWNRTIKNVFVTKDFDQERTEIHRHHGGDSSSSSGDYVAQILVEPLITPPESIEFCFSHE